MAIGWDKVMDIIMAGIGAGSLFGGGSGQERATYEGERRGDLSLDPRDLLGMGVTSIGRMGDDLYDRFAEGAYLPGAFAQSPPTFTGGGLPMPIGVTGRDLQEARPDQQTPHLRSGGGVTRRDPFQGVGNMMSGNPQTGGWPDTSGGGPAPDPSTNSRLPDQEQPGGEKYDPFSDAYAAIDLLNAGSKRSR